MTRSNTLWLVVGMAPAVLLPAVWYVVLLWYNGFWSDRASRLHRRQHRWLWLIFGAVGLGFVGLGLLGLPYIPVIGRLTALVVSQREFIKTSALGVPAVAVGYSLYAVLCVVLSLDALRHPGHPGRILGDAARRRARPWLAAATLLMLLVAILVAAVVLWTITNTRSGGYYVLTPDKLKVIGRFDLVISALIAAAAVLLGQAMTAYELFTGRTLPRRGLARQWKQALLLASSYGLLMGGALVWGIEPVYGVLLTALMMAAFLPLLGWRSHVAWEQAMRQLRPFVASERWYDALTDSRSATGQWPDPFETLCDGLLNTSLAHLIPLGSTANFVTPRHYPGDQAARMPFPATSIEGISEDVDLIVPVDPSDHGGAAWAVPLWRERGLIGMLFLGPRRDGRLYAQEEIEIARSTGERLIDTAASLTLSQRLMRLQRERMASTQILDQRTRRTLHDEVLPLIHTALLSVSARQPDAEALRHLSEAHQQVSNLLRELPPTVAPEIARFGLVAALRKAIEVEFAPAFDAVRFDCSASVEARLHSLNPVAAETLYYATREVVRNAARHARPPGGASKPSLEVSVRTSDDQLSIIVEDNGPGIEQDAAEGQGQGLALHSTLMAVVGGSLSLEATPGTMTMTRVQLTLHLDSACPLRRQS